MRAQDLSPEVGQPVREACHKGMLSLICYEDDEATGEIMARRRAA